jgi:hypothetical protein
MFPPAIYRKMEVIICAEIPLQGEKKNLIDNACRTILYNDFLDREKKKGIFQKKPTNGNDAEFIKENKSRRIT